MKKVSFWAAVLGVLGLGMAPQAKASYLTQAIVSASAHRGPHVHTAGVRIDNGVIIQSFGDPANGSEWEAGPILPGATAVFANAEQVGFSTVPLNAFVEASANLATGQLKARNVSTGTNTFGSPLASARAQWSDRLTFVNTTGGDLVLPFIWSVDGSVILPGSALIETLLYIETINDGHSAARLRGHLYGGGIVTRFNPPNATYSYELFANTPVPYGSSAGWDLTDISDDLTMGIRIASELIVPTGTHSMNVNARLDLDCRAMASCDFGNTAKFSFGDLPTGLTYTSDSGVFLSAVAPTAVPEPATTAMLGLGMGALAAARWRRRTKY
jgi:hypothetical protein